MSRATVGEAHARQRPPRSRGEEVAVGRSGVVEGREGAAAAQHHLSGHELPVVFADGAVDP